ncbi:DivIVA domain-containing protein [Echinicola jeungdonensis]|uniref:DivIVA domain-containing protein n=1 Tax=Echinicola jeungdonensis TaxID=709343 RepID=A0ABV5J0T8_9BACT|nr:DivIVA domain-containing protein [Echinicola jeungdonensis]MDN3668274.1 DivIVA domain-containing protein [Echinicola jeungdonensis]
MKITPLEIRQKTFEKNFRGFDKEEVASFLASLSQEWEKIMDEKKGLEIKLEQVQKESAKLREVEGSLFKTLKAAEDTGANMIEQANKTAELILKEAQMNSDAMLSEAKNKSRAIIESAETKAKRIMEDMKEDASVLVEDYEDLLAQREVILRNLKNLANNTQETIKHSQDDLKRVDMEAHAKLVKTMSRKVSFDDEDNVGSHIEARPKERESESEVTETTPPVSIPGSSVAEAEETPEKTGPETKEEPGNIQNREETSHNEDDTSSQAPDEPKQKKSGSFFDQFD